MSKDKYPSFFFALNGGYWAYFASNVFATQAVLKIEENHSDIS